MTRPVYPHEFLTILHKINNPMKWIDFAYTKMKSDEFQRAAGDTKQVGYFMLQKEEMQKLFQPIFDKLKMNLKILSAYIHYTAKGGGFADHIHDKTHAVYYLQTPTNSGMLTFPDFEEYFHPEKYRFRFIPKDVLHGISEHKNDIERIAITMQFEN